VLHVWSLAIIATSQLGGFPEAVPNDPPICWVVRVSTLAWATCGLSRSAQAARHDRNGDGAEGGSPCYAVGAAAPGHAPAWPGSDAAGAGRSSLPVS